MISKYEWNTIYCGQAMTTHSSYNTYIFCFLFMLRQTWKIAVVFFQFSAVYWAVYKNGFDSL